MKVDCALLCDAVTIRDGLLHILGGGVNRITRDDYPAPAGVQLALRLLLGQQELNRDHTLSVQLRDESGKNLDRLDVGFVVGAPEAGEVRQMLHSASFAIPTQALTVPAPGKYSLVLNVDDSGEDWTVQFEADRRVPSPPPRTDD